jgi:hypothetical protein
MTGLSLNDIVTLAERESGAHGLADEGLVARIGGMVDWINGAGSYSPDQLRAMQQQFQRMLTNRLKLALDRKHMPAIAEEKIERPVFIIGFARSGTTLLHSLLAEDEEVLSPQSWHMYSPSPPPGAGRVAAERIAYAQRHIEAWMDFCPAQKPMHPYIDKGAWQLIEDEEVAALDFRMIYPYHFYRVPVLDGLKIPPQHTADIFRFHRQFLQHLQWNTGKTRWVCKGPSHQMNLATLLEVYPDALCVWAHRPLGEIYASHVTLRAAIYDTICGRPLDWSNQARGFAEGLKAAVDKLMASELIDDPRVLHMSFHDIAADPIGAVRQVYERQGLVLTAETEARMRGWMSDPENATDRYGRYPYSYEALGLDKAWIENLFADYSTRFGLT